MNFRTTTATNHCSHCLFARACTLRHSHIPKTMGIISECDERMKLKHRIYTPREHRTQWNEHTRAQVKANCFCLVVCALVFFLVFTHPSSFIIFMRYLRFSLLQNRSQQERHIVNRFIARISAKKKPCENKCAGIIAYTTHINFI